MGLATPTIAENSFHLGAGTAYMRDFRPSVEAGVRHYFNESDQGFFVQGRLVKWDGDKPVKNFRRPDGTFMGASFGYRFNVTPKWYAEASTGPGYLDHNTDLLSGHRQFESQFNAGYRATRKTNLYVGWNHISNGQPVLCSKKSECDPNSGIDFLRIGFERRF